MINEVESHTLAQLSMWERESRAIVVYNDFNESIK